MLKPCCPLELLDRHGCRQTPWCDEPALVSTRGYLSSFANVPPFPPPRLKNRPYQDRSRIVCDRRTTAGGGVYTAVAAMLLSRCFRARISVAMSTSGRKSSLHRWKRQRTDSIHSLEALTKRWVLFRLLSLLLSFISGIFFTTMICFFHVIVFLLSFY